MKIGLALACAVVLQAQPECAECHAEIARTYAQTGMARSFSRPCAVPDGDYYHAASDTHFSMFTRDGALFQRRYQIGFANLPVNVEEKRVDYVMGSGAHVMTFLHRTDSGALQQLPLAWYAEKGGEWAMNPGYDKPDQPNSRRKIDYECMFCHNAYPRVAPGHEEFRAEPRYASIPQGIDCQRCHGPGEAHIAAAKSGASLERIRAAIVNPKRLPPDRRADVCNQCHLETTSFPFPHAIVKFDRAPFSFRPGERLADFAPAFDHPEQDRFQIVSSVYRLRQSACFVKSGKLECTTCHDPHRNTSLESVDRACRNCHATPSAHMDQSGCAACHMPKRRTSDVVHAVMTDHRIQRRPSPNLLDEFAEPHGQQIMYRGEVFSYGAPADSLYLALAQVRERNNLDRGLPQLASALAKSKDARPEFFVELGDAWIAAKDSAKAIAAYREALRRAPNLNAARIALGEAYRKSNDYAKAAEAFEKASAWRQLGEVYVELHRSADAIATLRKAIEDDAEDPAAHYDLGLALSAADRKGAAAEFQEAIRLKPDDAPSHMNLAIVLFGLNEPAESAWHFERALRIDPNYALGHLNYARMLEASGRREEAAEHFRKAGTLPE